MSGIYEIFGDTPIGTTGGTLIVYGTCLVFLFMLLKEGMIRNVLSDGFSWVVVYGLLAVVVIAALVYTHGAFVNIDPGLTAAGIQPGLYKGFPARSLIRTTTRCSPTTTKMKMAPSTAT